MVESGSREKDMANKTQSAKNGSHAARAIAQRRMSGRTIALEIISTRTPFCGAIHRRRMPLRRKWLAQREDRGLAWTPIARRKLCREASYPAAGATRRQ